MNPRTLARLAPVLLLSAAIGGCALDEGADGGRFERMAQAVAAVPVDASGQAQVQSPAALSGQPLKVEIVDGLELSAQRIGLRPMELLADMGAESLGLQPTAGETPPVLAMKAPESSSPIPGSSPQPTGTATVRVGAYGSQEAAERAWAALKASTPAAAKLNAAYERVTVGEGEVLIRLKVGPTTAAAAPQLCRSLGVTDAWCARTSG
jgi:hypothetical protein